MPSTVDTRSRRASALPPDERRAAIIASTEPLLLEFGDSVTTRQIAAAAGVAEGTLFRVFADKDELLAATVEAALDPERFEAAVRKIDPDLDFETRLVAATRLVGKRVVYLWRLFSSIGPRARVLEERPLPDSEALAAIFESEADRFSVEPHKAAQILRALTLSTTHPLLAHEPMDPSEIVDLLLHGIEVRP